MYVAKTKALISFAVTAKLICVFVFAYAKCWFSHDAAHMLFFQINLYLLSRILYGLAKMAVKRGYIPEPKGDTFRWFGAIVWGIVLWQFEYEKDTLQGSLQSSMTYLYHDSNQWNNIWNFLIYNK